MLKVPPVAKNEEEEERCKNSYSSKRRSIAPKLAKDKKRKTHRTDDRRRRRTAEADEDDYPASRRTAEADDDDDRASTTVPATTVSSGVRLSPAVPCESVAWKQTINTYTVGYKGWFGWPKEANKKLFGKASLNEKLKEVFNRRSFDIILDASMICDAPNRAGHCGLHPDFFLAFVEHAGFEGFCKAFKKYLARCKMPDIDLLVVCHDGRQRSVAGAEAVRAIVETCLGPEIRFKPTTIHMSMMGWKKHFEECSMCNGKTPTEGGVAARTAAVEMWRTLQSASSERAIRN